MKKSLGFVVGVALASSAAWGGLRGVGRGGGFGEMQAYLADQRLPGLLEACWRLGCGVRRDEIDGIKADTRELKLDSTCGKPASDATAVTVSSCDLYEFASSGQLLRARPFNEIAAVVFTARTGRPLAESLRLLRDLTVNRKTTPITAGDSELAQHYLEVRLGAQGFNSLAIEGFNETVEITNTCEAALNCPAAGLTWQLGRTVTAAGEGHNYLAESAIAWTCGGVSRSGKLKIFVRYSNRRLEAGNIRVLVTP